MSSRNILLISIVSFFIMSFFVRADDLDYSNRIASCPQNGLVHLPETYPPLAFVIGDESDLFVTQITSKILNASGEKRPFLIYFRHFYDAISGMLDEQLSQYTYQLPFSWRWPQDILLPTIDVSITNLYGPNRERFQPRCRYEIAGKR